MSIASYYASAGIISRAIPTFVAATSSLTRQSQTGAALTPDNTQNGDLIIGLDARTASITPTLTAGVTEIIPGGVSIGGGVSIRLWYKFITAGETIGASDIANRRLLLPYRNVDPTTPILSAATPMTTTGTTGIIPALSTFDNAALGLVVAGYIHDNATAALTLGSPLTQREILASTSTPHLAGDSTNVVTSFTAQSFTVAATAWIGYSLALLGAPL